MVFAGLLIYGLLSSSPDLFKRFFLPLFIVGGYCFVFSYNEGLENWQYYLFLSMPVVRALSGMSAGVLAGLLQEKGLLTRQNTFFNTAIEFCSAVFVAIGLFTDIGSDMLTVIAFGGILWCGVTRNGLIGKALDRRCFARVSEYSYSVYLNHALVLVVLMNINKTVFPVSSALLRAIIYFLAVIIWSIVFHAVVKKCQARMSKT